jgi:hypothetical protein
MRSVLARIIGVIPWVSTTDEGTILAANQLKRITVIAISSYHFSEPVLVPLIAISGTATNPLGEAWRSTLCGHVTEVTARYAFNQWSA